MTVVVMVFWWACRRNGGFIRCERVSGVQIAIFMLLVGRWMGGVGMVEAEEVIEQEILGD